MTLKAICPECGMSGDMAAFMTQGEHNQALAAALEIPAMLGPRIVRYLGLFRPPSRALAGAKAVRLLTELRDAIGSERIDRKGVSRPAPVGIWATALDQLLERPPSKLPLTGHGYLFEVVASVADKTDARAEQQREQAARQGQIAPSPTQAPAMTRREKTTEEILAYHQRMASRQAAASSDTPRGLKSLSQLLQKAPKQSEE